MLSLGHRDSSVAGVLGTAARVPAGVTRVPGTIVDSSAAAHHATSPRWSGPGATPDGGEERLNLEEVIWGGGAAGGGSRGGRIEATRAESQWIVAARPLCHLQYPIAYLSRLQRILPAARWELRFRATREARPPREFRQRHVPLGGRGPLLLVGKRTAGARIASSPDSDLEAFSHNPTHGSFAPLAFQPSAMTNCANQRFLSY